MLSAPEGSDNKRFLNDSAQFLSPPDNPYGTLPSKRGWPVTYIYNVVLDGRIRNTSAVIIGSTFFHNLYFVLFTPIIISKTYINHWCAFPSLLLMWLVSLLLSRAHCCSLWSFCGCFGHATLHKYGQLCCLRRPGGAWSSVRSPRQASMAVRQHAGSNPFCNLNPGRGFMCSIVLPLLRRVTRYHYGRAVID